MLEQTLDERFLEKIKQFKNSNLFLQVTVTPKAHAIFYHVLVFIERGVPLHLVYSVNRQQKQVIHYSKITKEIHPIQIMDPSFCSASSTSTANVCEVIEETF